MKFLTKKPKKNSSPVFDMLAIFGVERNTNTAPTVESVEYNEPETIPELKEETLEEPVFSVPVQAAEDHIAAVEAVHKTVSETIQEKTKEEVPAIEKIETPQTHATTENHLQKISIMVTEDEETPPGYIPETLHDAVDPPETYNEQNPVPPVLESEINPVKDSSGVFIPPHELPKAVTHTAERWDIVSNGIKIADTPEEYKNIGEVLVAKDALWTNQEVLAENTRPPVIETPSQKYFNVLDTNLMTAARNPEEEVPSQELPQEIDRESYEKIVCETTPQNEIDPEAEKTVVPIKIGEEEKSSEPYASKSFYVTLS